jgi:hypothetical protein
VTIAAIAPEVRKTVMMVVENMKLKRDIDIEFN